MKDDREAGHGFCDPREQDIMAGDRRTSRPDASLPDWEVPDTAYRPIPIVWFTSALLTQFALVSVLVIALWERSAWFTFALTALGTAAIAHWTWERGMSGAARGWQGATAMMLVGLLVLAGLVAFAKP